MQLCCFQGLGFGISSTPASAAEAPKKNDGWQAPYKLSDKYQQEPESTKRKRSKSPSRYRPHSGAGERHGSRHPASSESQRAADKETRNSRSHSKQPDRLETSHRRHKADRQHRHSHSRHRETSPEQGHHSRHVARSRHRNRARSHSKEERSPHRYTEHHSSRDRVLTTYEHNRSKASDSSSKHTEHHADRHRSADDRHHGKSWTTDSSRRQAQTATRPPDYAKLIADYSSMGPAERLKAVTEYKLRKTSSKVLGQLCMGAC